MRNMTSSDRVWPKTGLWAASFRVMFPLAALWAVISVAIWQWGQAFWPNLHSPVLHNPVAWHIHEMTLGFGGAALAGYLLTACSSWTGRAPVHGWPLMVLAALWIGARIAIGWGPAPLAIVLNVAVFWWLAALLTHEARRGAKQMRLGFIGFSLLAGVVSGLWILKMHGDMTNAYMVALPPLLFCALLMVVGGRMVPAFLAHEALRLHAAVRPEPWWLFWAPLVALGCAATAFASDQDVYAANLLRIAGLALVARMVFWPVRVAFGHVLLAILYLGFLWLPIGLVLWGNALVNIGSFAPPEALHALAMGGMGGLIMAVSARAVAHRTPQGLQARRATLWAFLLVWISVWTRMAGALDAAAALWCAGWLVYLIAYLPALRGPVPRPVFSGARNT